MKSAKTRFSMYSKPQKTRFTNFLSRRDRLGLRFFEAQNLFFSRSQKEKLSLKKIWEEIKKKFRKKYFEYKCLKIEMAMMILLYSENFSDFLRKNQEFAFLTKLTFSFWQEMKEREIGESNNNLSFSLVLIWSFRETFEIFKYKFYERWVLKQQF